MQHLGELAPPLTRAVLETWPWWHGCGRTGPDAVSHEHGRADSIPCQLPQAGELPPPLIVQSKIAFPGGVGAEE